MSLSNGIKQNNYNNDSILNADKFFSDEEEIKIHRNNIKSNSHSRNNDLTTDNKNIINSNNITSADKKDYSLIKKNIIKKITNTSNFSADINKLSNTLSNNNITSNNITHNTIHKDDLTVNTNNEFNELTKILKNQTQDYIIHKYNNTSSIPNSTTNNNNNNPALFKILKNQNTLNTYTTYNQLTETTDNNVNIMTTQSKITTTQAIEKSNYLHNIYKEQINKRSQLCSEAQQIKEEKELEECTFTPNTEMYKGTRNEAGEIYERNINWKSKKQVWLEQERNNLNEKFSANHTFKPSINKMKVDYGDMDEKQMNFTIRFKERMNEAEKRKKEENEKLNRDYNVLYDKTHNYNKNIEAYFDKMGVSGVNTKINNNYVNNLSGLNSGRKSINGNKDISGLSHISSNIGSGYNKSIYNNNNNFVNSYNGVNFNNLDMNIVITTLRNEIKEADLEVNF